MRRGRVKPLFLMQDTRALYGAERATVRLVAALRRAGVPAEVLLLEEARLAAEGESPLAAAFREVAPVEGIPVAGRISWSAARRIRERVAAEGDGALVHSTGYKADVHAVLASRGSRLFPVVSTVHGWLFRRDLKEQAFLAANLWALRRCSRVVVLSGFYEEWMLRHGFTPLQLARIPTAYPAERVPEEKDAAALWEDAGTPFVFGTLGRLSEEKDHEMLLRAAARLARLTDGAPRPWRVLIAGDGPLRERLQKRIVRLGLADRTELAGPMDSDAFFRRVHVLVQCSRVENQPMSVMEAMAWARPVIATRAGGLPEWVEDDDPEAGPCGEGTGRLVPCRDDAALADALLEAWRDPGRARAEGSRGRQRLLAAPGIEAMVRDHLGVYAAALPAARG